MTNPKIAIVCDWLTVMGGAEKLVLDLHKLFPDAPIYTSVYDRQKMPEFAGFDVRTTWLEKVLPKKLRYKHVLWPVLRAFAFRSLNLTDFDIIISSSSAESKAVKKRPDAIHICYCHTPIRYYYSHYDEFRREFNFGPLTFLIRPFIPIFVAWMRKLDLASVKNVDYFIANSNVTKARIKKYYGRDAEVIFPPIDIERFKKIKSAKIRDGFIVWGRHVPYKRFDLAIAACNAIGAKLTIVGTGPDTARLQKLAGPSVNFAGRVSNAELVRLAQSHQAFLFPGEEDFGMSAVEALSAGLPVIAYARGGSTDIVQAGVNGILFGEQTQTSLVEAIKKFNNTKFNEKAITNSAKQFSVDKFVNKIKTYVTNKWLR